jgi:hypothetical protein
MFESSLFKGVRTPFLVAIILEKQVDQLINFKIHSFIPSIPSSRSHLIKTNQSPNMKIRNPQKPKEPAKPDSKLFANNKPYMFIPYTPTLPRLRPNLTIHHPSTYTYAGPLLLSLPQTFHIWASRTFSSTSALFSLLAPLLTFLSTFLPSVGLQCYCLSIRASKADSAYDVPRWHVDDDFFRASETSEKEDGGGKKGGKRRRWKLCTTLLGSGTLFPTNNTTALKIVQREKAHEKKNHEHVCTSIRCLGCATYAAELRNILIGKFERWETTAPKGNEVAVFRIGDEGGAVHSEPKCEGDRVFVNVVPGTEEDVRGLMGRWGMAEWPRGWSVDGFEEM